MPETRWERANNMQRWIRNTGIAAAAAGGFAAGIMVPRSELPEKLARVQVLEQVREPYYKYNTGPGWNGYVAEGDTLDIFVGLRSADSLLQIVIPGKVKRMAVTKIDVRDR